MPVYGLAENSVALCFPPVGRGPRLDRDRARARSSASGRAEPAGRRRRRAPLRFVSVGRALPEHEVRIVDDAGQRGARAHAWAGSCSGARR